VSADYALDEARKEHPAYRIVPDGNGYRGGRQWPAEGCDPVATPAVLSNILRQQDMDDLRAKAGLPPVTRR